MLRVVVVLYRSRLRVIRALVERLEAASLAMPVTLTVVINRDVPAPSRRPRCLSLSGGNVQVEVAILANRAGVAGAYNFVIRRAEAEDILILLDSDSSAGADFFQHVVENSAALRSGVLFTTPDQRSCGVRVSPYRLGGIVPELENALLPSGLLQFQEGWGVINSALAGSIGSFRTVDGFDEEVGLDLSDVVWSLRAARRAASLLIAPVVLSHELSMLNGAFSLRRLRTYLRACWRVGRMEHNWWGAFRLAIRGVRASLKSVP